MDITGNTITSSSSWDLDISMWNHLLLDQNPFDLVQLMDPFPVQIGAQTELDGGHEKGEDEGLGAMKEMMYKIAAMQPVDIDPSTIKKPKRRNVRISEDPQSIAARHRRERISERIRILQRMVPGGTKMDTASMLDEAIRYVKFLKRRVQELQPKPPSPLGPVEWLVGPETRGCSSSTSPPTMGADSGLGFGFASINGPCDGMD